MAKEEENKERYQVGQIATETEQIIVDTKEDNKQFNIQAAMAEIMNKLDKVIKTLD